MRYPVPFRILIGGLFAFSLHSFALTQDEARDGATCKSGAELRPGFRSSFDKTWQISNGRDCEKLKNEAQQCCGGNCEPVLRNYFGSNYDSENPLKGAPDEIPPANCSGVHGPQECQKANALRAFRTEDRSAAVCRAIAQSCRNQCGTNFPSQCGNGLSHSDRTCASANTNVAKYDGINPADTAQQPPPGGDPTQGTPGQAPTQKPGGGMASGLQQAAGALLPALMQAMQEDEPSQQPQSFQSQTCAENPNLAGCVTKSNESDSWNKSAPAGVEAANLAETGGDMNVASSDAANPTYNGNGEQKFGTPASNAAIPNGGGQMPGQNGAGGAAGGQTTGGFGLNSKAATDIMHGMMGGGFSAMNANMPMQNGAGGGFGGYGQGAQEFKPGMDLRAFLPGGKQDPTRKLAGGAASFQIQPQTVNIWSRISERFKARCNQGLLRDCNGQ